jgi:hypothetical protein
LTTSIQVVIDCADPHRLALFWAAALGHILQPPPEGFDSWEAFLLDAGVPEERWNSSSAVVDPAGRGPRIFFQRVPEGKTVKNRVHLDLNLSSGRSASLEQRRAEVEAAATRLEGLGATRLYAVEEWGGFHVTMADPEGNEFCVQ